MKTPTTSVFATKNTTSEEVAMLIRVGLETANPNGTVAWSKVQDKIPGLTIKYSRGWLIIRRAWLEVNTPDALVDTDAIVKAHKAKIDELNEHRKQGEEALTFDEYHVLGTIVAELHDKNMSWGEIMCRMGIVEGRARKALERSKHIKTRGLRTGKGGRFVFDDPTLYLDNMKSEGVHWQDDYRGREVEKALNYKPKEGEAAKPKKAAKAA